MKADPSADTVKYLYRNANGYSDSDKYRLPFAGFQKPECNTTCQTHLFSIHQSKEKQP